MTVTIDPNIKKNRIFLNKNGEQITEDQLFGNKMGNVMGTTSGANNGQQTIKESSEEEA